MKYIFRIAAILAILPVSCRQPDKKIPEVSPANIEKHIIELSDDCYLGRAPFWPGEEILINYLAEQMKEIGLEAPFTGNYFQQVPILQVSSQMSPFMEVNTPAGEMQLKKLEEYVTFSRKVSVDLGIEDSDVIFAGFGIHAPEYNRNDFEGIDVKGKTILVFVNDPGYGKQGDYFKGNTMTYYGRWTYKFEEAARQGARACFIIHETGPAGYPWEVAANNGDKTSVYLQSDDGYADRCDMEGWISESVARRLFEACGTTFEKAKEEAASPAFKPRLLPVKFTASLKNSYDTGTSNNVAGILKGKTRPEEAVVVTAHWDHLGVGKSIDGDSIYNGATDNAAGVAWLLEMARVIRAAGPTDRSIIFLSPTAEESGLLGAEYYAANPVHSMEKTVAVVNTDVILFLGEFNDVTLTGYGQSDIDGMVAEIAKRNNRYVAPDPNPENGMFFRSDHFPFVRRGVPAVFAKGNIDARNLGKEKTLQVVADYWKNTYHKPSDEYVAGRDDLSGLVADTRLMAELVMKLANSNVWPAWNEGSEFKHLRKK